MDYVVTKHIKDEPAELHFIKMPETCAKGWYTAVTSATAFQSRMQKRHIEVIKSPTKAGVFARAFAVDFYYSLNLRRDWDSTEEILAKAGLPNYSAGSKRFEHASLWAFYDHIGYDHKRNKLKVEPVRLK